MLRGYIRRSPTSQSVFPRKVLWLFHTNFFPNTSLNCQIQTSCTRTYWYIHTHRLKLRILHSKWFTNDATAARSVLTQCGFRFNGNGMTLCRNRRGPPFRTSMWHHTTHLTRKWVYSYWLHGILLHHKATEYLHSEVPSCIQIEPNVWFVIFLIQKININCLGRDRAILRQWAEPSPLIKC